MHDFEIAFKCWSIFRNLGWEVSREERIAGTDYRHDLVLRHHDKLYGFVEVVCGNNLAQKAVALCNLIDGDIKENKTPIFVITNGFVYDLYVMGDFFGTLSVPPTPANIDVLLGGECCE